MDLSTRKLLSDDVFIIADIGKNFIQTEEGKSVDEYLRNAKDLVDAAKNAGVDAVKFQTHEVEDEQMDIDITSPHFQGSDRYSWVSRNTEITPLEEFWKPLKKYCDECGIVFFSTPMSRKAAEKLDEVGVPFWKVGSGDVQDYIMLDFIISTGKPIIISTGMVSLNELNKVVEYITSKNSPLIVFYCVSQYPCPLEEFNLGTIEYLKEKYPDVVIGFSDHSLGYDASLAAIKLGAKVMEKHFSLSRDLWGADHKVSMTPDEMKEMVDKIKNNDFKNIDESTFFGEKEKELEGANNKFRPYFNKTLVSGTNIPAGGVITKEMVFAMRPKMYINGLSSDRLEDIVGRRAKKDLKKYEPILETCLL